MLGRTRPGRAVTGPPTFDWAIVVTSEESLVAESVAAALAQRGFEPRVVAPGTAGGRVSADSSTAPARAGLLMSGLDSYRSIGVAQDHIESIDVPWLVVSGAPRGPAWGALLESGASRVVDSSVSLVEIATLLESLVLETHVGDHELDDDLRRQWHAFERERTEVAARLAALTPWELEVLRSLYLGRTIAEIATSHRVSEVAVRHRVQTVLGKLDLGSQLAAVTRLSRLLVLEGGSDRPA